MADVVGGDLAVIGQSLGEAPAAPIDRREEGGPLDRLGARDRVQTSFGAAMARDIARLSGRRVPEEPG